MKDASKKADVEKEPEKETEKGPEELSIEEEEAMEAADELEEAEDETAEKGVFDEELEEPLEEEALEEQVVEEEVVEEPIEEEERPERREREEIDEEIVEERIYTIPLGRAWISTPRKRAPRAIRVIKSFIMRHMKIKTDAIEEEAERLVISNEVNERIWSRGIKSPPRKIRVRAVKDKEGTVTLRLAEED